MDYLEGIFIAMGILCAIGIAWQDFKAREIHVGLFALMGLSGFVFRAAETGWDFLGGVVANCLMIILIILVVLLIYRAKGETDILDTKLGWGDIVMFGVLGIWLDPPLFILFYSGSTLCITIAYVLLGTLSRKTHTYSIPLAGLMGLLFAGFLPLWQMYFPQGLQLI